jgi:hypothetical protein
MIAPERTIKEEDWTAPFDATPESAPAASWRGGSHRDRQIWSARKRLSRKARNA